MTPSEMMQLREMRKKADGSRLSARVSRDSSITYEAPEVVTMKEFLASE